MIPGSSSFDKYEFNGVLLVTSSTKTEIRTEICSKCHPFWTGEQRIVDTEGRVERMMRRYKLSNEQKSE